MMRNAKLIAGAVVMACALAGVTAASAADMAPRMYTKAPIPVVIYDWTGFYIGGNVGYSWGRARTDGTETGTQSVSEFRTAGPTLLPGFPVVTTLAATPLSGRSNVNGVIGGGQAGYNWQRGTWLFGLETDIQGSGERGSSDLCAVAAGCPTGTGLFTANYKLDWFGTARGRIGILPTDRVLLYATGGLAYGGVSATAPAIPLSWGSTRAGWTVGAGAEVAIDHHWSIKLEYLYMDIGDVGDGSTTATTVVTQPGVPVRRTTVTTTTFTSAFGTRFTDNILRVGVNYRFDAPVVAKY
jgi:outer membrane immunogenic protein